MHFISMIIRRVLNEQIIPIPNGQSSFIFRQSQMRTRLTTFIYLQHILANGSHYSLHAYISHPLHTHG